MKVNLASQVLSQSVASGIRSIVIVSNKLPQDTIYTANFLIIYLKFLMQK